MNVAGIPLGNVAIKDTRGYESYRLISLVK